MQRDNERGGFSIYPVADNNKLIRTRYVQYKKQDTLTSHSNRKYCSSSSTYNRFCRPACSSSSSTHYSYSRRYLANCCFSNQPPPSPRLFIFRAIIFAPLFPNWMCNVDGINADNVILFSFCRPSPTFAAWREEDVHIVVSLSWGCHYYYYCTYRGRLVIWVVDVVG